MTQSEQLDRAVSLLRELDSLKTERPEVPRPWDRALARGFDFGFVVVAGVVLAAIQYVLEILIWGGRDLEELQNPSTPELALSAGFALLWLAVVVWNEAVGLGRGRQTYGKRLLGIQVVIDSSGAAAGSARMLGRFATLVVPTVLILLTWELIATGVPAAIRFPAAIAVLAVPGLLFVGRSGRGLHDRVWGTRLVRPR